MNPRLPQPKKTIFDIAPYVGGKSSVAGQTRVIKLSSNENPLGPSPTAIEAYKAASASLHRYPDGTALKLREAIGETYGLDPARIVCGAGSDELIAFLANAYTTAGDEVLYSAHGFLMYKIYAQSYGAVPVTAPEKNLTADVEALLAAVTERTKILFLANPNNPTGSYLPASKVQELRTRLRSDILLVLDAAYAEYVTAVDYEPGAALVNETENTVMLRTFSKVYGLPALRLGWGYMPAAIADVLNRVRGPFNVSSPAIAAGVAAVKDQAWVQKSVEHNTLWLAKFGKAIRALGLNVHPSVVNFILVEFTSNEQAKAANQYLMQEGLIVREVANYGLAQHLRITIGTEKENELLLTSLARFMERA